MIRSPAVLLAFALVAPAATAAPTLKGKEVYYHPTTEGDKRVYESRDGDRVRETADVVIKVEKKGETLIVTVGREIKGETRAIGKSEVSDKGVTVLMSGPFPLKTPHPKLKLPAKAGDQWTYESDGGDGPAGSKTTHTVAKEEEVEVPAGKFKALRVDSELTVVGLAVESTRRRSDWYAPRVGLVKSVINSGPRESTMVLKSFTPGK
jgi:hypothetical protein